MRFLHSVGTIITPWALYAIGLIHTITPVLQAMALMGSIWVSVITIYKFIKKKDG